MLKKLLISSAFGLLLSMGVAVGGEIVVKVRPPEAIVETRPVAPGAGYVWVGGYHRWNGHAYVWEAGRWNRPPHAGWLWVDHRWEERNGHWVFIKGRWRRP